MCGLIIMSINKKIMDKKNKGLADNQDGDFVLNESGTSVSNPVEEEVEKFDEVIPDHKPKEDTDEISSTDDV